MASSMRIGIDIGGTFTDFTVVDDATGEITVEKLLTSHDAPEITSLAGIDALAARQPSLLANTSAVIHATTLVTNTILERKGARTALLTTEGFRDILELAREVRYDVFDMFIQLPKPIVPRPLRLGIRERVLADGSVLIPLHEEDVRAAAAQFRAAKVEAVAVAFLHSYRTPDHERRAAEILREELPGIAISMLHEVHPEPREYERSSSTAIDAYVKAVVATYLDRMQDGLASRGYQKSLFVMLSNGGTATVATAKRVPIQMVESGPAAGVEAASLFGRLLGLNRVLSFDMGGTTAKLCLISEGEAARTRVFEVDRVHRFKKGSGLPVTVPVYDLLEIGAGGGSIARINNLGLLQVGPESSGSTPGPACYGLGGSEPTVTDADLLLGHLDAESFLGGAMRLDVAAATQAFSHHISSPTGMTPLDAASGVNDLVNETMASAARMYLAEKGASAIEMTMIAFGGAGPVHAVGLARRLGCPTVVVPPLPGVMSSLGLLAAPIAFERTQAIRQLLSVADLAGMERLFTELEAIVREPMPDQSLAVISRSVFLRYSGQEQALEIPIGLEPPAEKMRAIWAERFLTAYAALYGKIDDDSPIEIASVRVMAAQATPPLNVRPQRDTEISRPRMRKLWIAERREKLDVPVYARASLVAGQEIAGPAIVEERESTTIIGPGDRLTVDALGCLIVRLVLPLRDEQATEAELAS